MNVDMQPMLIGADWILLETRLRESSDIRLASRSRACATFMAIYLRVSRTTRTNDFEPSESMI